MATRRGFIKSIGAASALAAAIATATRSLRVFLVDDGEQHWYAAFSERDAIDAHMRLCGDEYPELEESIEVVECNLNQRFTIRDEHTNTRETKALRDWLAECEPGDLVATSVH